jgi:hypothetical protein
MSCRRVLRGTRAPSSKDIHGIVMALVAAMFRTHVRDGFTVMKDVYCDLSDAAGPSLRAPDVVIVGDLTSPRNEAYRGTPVLAVEVRGTQSRRYLEEKVQLRRDRASSGRPLDPTTRPSIPARS